MLGCGCLSRACSAFGPRRNPPQMPPTAHYAVGRRARAVARRGRHRPAPGRRAARPVPEWWKAYQSAALDALVEEGLDEQSVAGRRAAHAQGRARSAAFADRPIHAAERRRGLQTRRASGRSAFPFCRISRPSSTTSSPPRSQTSYTFDFFGAALLANRALALSGQAAGVPARGDSARACRQYRGRDHRCRLAAGAGRRHANSWSRSASSAPQQTAARYQLGSASHDDMLAAEQDAANAAATLPALRARLLAVRHAQAVLLGRTPDQAPAPLPLDALQSAAERTRLGAFRSAASAAGYSGGRSERPGDGG